MKIAVANAVGSLGKPTPGVCCGLRHPSDRELGLRQIFGRELTN